MIGTQTQSSLDRFNNYLKEEPLNVGDLTFWDLTFEGYTLKIDRDKLGGYDLHISVKGHSDIFMDHRTVRLVKEDGSKSSPIELRKGHGKIRVPPGQYTLRFES